MNTTTRTSLRLGNATASAPFSPAIMVFRRKHEVTTRWVRGVFFRRTRGGGTT